MAYTYEDRYHLVIERPGAPPEKREGTALTEFAYASKPAPLAGM
jgi:hypothetical protein